MWADMAAFTTNLVNCIKQEDNKYVKYSPQNLITSKHKFLNANWILTDDSVLWSQGGRLL